MNKEESKQMLKYYEKTTNLEVVYMSNCIVIIYDGIEHCIYYQDIENITVYMKGTNVKLIFWLGTNKLNQISLLLQRKEVENE